MKRYLTLFFLLITSLALCAYPEGAINNIDGSVLGWDNASQTWRPISVDANGQLNTSGGGSAWTSQDVSDLMDNVTNIPDGSGGTTSLGNMLGNINANVRDASQNASLFRMQRISNIASGTAVKLGYIADPEIGEGNETTDFEIRKFIELRAIDPSAEFYIGFDNTVSDSTGRPVTGRILINMDTNTDLYIYHTNDSAMSLQQTEGWIVK